MVSPIGAQVLLGFQGLELKLELDRVQEWLIHILPSRAAQHRPPAQLETLSPPALEEQSIPAELSPPSPPAHHGHSPVCHKSSTT